MKKLINLKYQNIIGFLLLMMYSQFCVAQKKITLNQAIDEALKNNLSMKNERLKMMYQQKVSKTYATIPLTNVITEAGQMNSIYHDTKFGIVQAFSLPMVYNQQRKILNEELMTASTGVAMKEIELSKNVKQVFSVILLWKEKEKILIKADSMYAEFLRKCTLRLSAGESNVLEKVSAESMQSSIHLQLKGIQQEIEVALLKLQLLMNTTDEIMPVSDDLKLNFIFTNDSISFQNHPSLQLFQHQKVLAKSQTNFEKAKLLPEISFGYFNTSIKGNGADNSFYTSSTRFNSFQIGIGVPIFFKAQQYRIKSSFIQQQIADNNFQNHFDEMKNEWKAYELQYSNNLQMVSYYEKSALTNAKLIESTAQQQFANGEINYLEWTMLINQSMAIQNNYLDIIKSLNESIINIQYLNSK